MKIKQIIRLLVSIAFVALGAVTPAAARGGGGGGFHGGGGFGGGFHGGGFHGGAFGAGHVIAGVGSRRGVFQPVAFNARKI